MHPISKTGRADEPFALQWTDEPICPLARSATRGTAPPRSAPAQHASPTSPPPAAASAEADAEETDTVGWCLIGGAVLILALLW